MLDNLTDGRFDMELGRGLATRAVVEGNREIVGTGLW